MFDRGLQNFYSSVWALVSVRAIYHEKGEHFSAAGEIGPMRGQDIPLPLSLP